MALRRSEDLVRNKFDATANRPLVIMNQMAPMKSSGKDIANLDAIVDTIRQAARIPGVAIAVVADDKLAFSQGYGYSDLDAKLSMASHTLYPIASTTKAINAMLLGSLVDEGLLAWDAPVQNYLPRFRLLDPTVSTQVTLRDLVVMRTGLPRHDWLWIENPISRETLIQRLRYLDLSAGFRERFQYNNLTVTAAAHVAEVVTGQSWEKLAKEKILTPLEMTSSGFGLMAKSNVTRSYHENSRRELVLTPRFATDVTAPSGGGLYSTVNDMALWVLFNLRGGKTPGLPLIKPETFAEIFSPQVAAGTDTTAPSANAAYAMGWFVDVYNGRAQISHSGYLHDVNSEVSLFPHERIGIVSFTNFGPPAVARFINQCAFDCIMGIDPAQTIEEKLREYERSIARNTERIASTRRVEGTAPSHLLSEYVGEYLHPGYGTMEIYQGDNGLCLQRNSLRLSLEHWHYDSWVVAENDLFPIHRPHAFDRSNRLQFQTNPSGYVNELVAPLEPAVPPIRFVKQGVMHG